MQNPTANIINESSIQLPSSDLPKFNIIKITKKKSTRNNEHPGKRWGHSVVIHDKKMILFGGRHNQRSLATLYSLNFNSLTWFKIEPYGQSPPARDSHSVLMYKNDMIIFGGSGFGKKLNDLWSFSFEQKKWTKIISTGDIPSPLEGHCVALIRNCFMMVYGGLDENDKDTNAIYLLDLRNNYWISAKSTGAEPELRDSQSCAMINNTCFIFGGQDSNDQRYNDMHLLNFEINETDKIFNAVWSIEDIKTKRPPARTSHSSVAYKSQYIFIIGGEGENQMPFNDIWIYNILSKEYSEFNIEALNEFEGRLCHSSILFNDIIVIYGGMKNVDQTLDNLILLCFENEVSAIDVSNLNQIESDKPNISNNEKEISNKYNNNDSNSNKVSNANTTSLIITQTDGYNTSSLLIKAITENKITKKEISTDTFDLNNDNMFIFSYIKQQSLNKLISWSFIKELSSIHRWPLGCIGNLIQNSLKKTVQARNVYIDIKTYENKCYHNLTNSNFGNTNNNGNPSSNQNNNNKKLVLSIIDDGLGISHKEFNEMMNSSYKNSEGEYSFLTKGINLKLSSISLANGVCIISKYNKELSICLISKSIQRTLDIDLLVTPIVQWTIDDTGKSMHSSIPFWSQTLNLILQEIYFIFPNRNSLFDYCKSFSQGTHIFLFDLKQILINKQYVNRLNNYELYCDYEANDIYYNIHCLNNNISNKIIDTSLRQYLSYMSIDNHSEAKVLIFNKEIDINNPYRKLKLYSKQISSIKCKEVSKLAVTIDQKIDCVCIENNNEFRGFLISLCLIENNKELNEKIEMNECNFPEYNNGILIYKNNVLVRRLNQNKFGDGLYHCKSKPDKNNNNNKTNSNKRLNSLVGYIDISNAKYELLPNKIEFKNNAMFSNLYSKLLNLTTQINN